MWRACDLCDILMVKKARGDVRILGRVIAVCGRICSGKTYYCEGLRAGRGGVTLSCDELMTALFHHQEGERFDEMSRDAKAYLHKKAAEIAMAGPDVILDWGFWRRDERREVTEYYRARNIGIEWHYIDINDADWRRNIDGRNKKVEAGESSDYYVDEGLLKKLERLFEAPERDEMDIWHAFCRK